VGLIGMWKALEEMEELGWVKGKRRRMIAVQAAGCAPVAKAFDEGADVTQMFENAATFASGLRVSKPYGDYIILEDVRKSGGTVLALSDQQLLTSLRDWALNEGILLSPEGAASTAAYDHLIEVGFSESRTGSFYSIPVPVTSTRIYLLGIYRVSTQCLVPSEHPPRDYLRKATWTYLSSMRSGKCNQKGCLICSCDRTERRFSTLAGRVTHWPSCGFSPLWIKSASAAPESIKTRHKAFTGRCSQKASISPCMTWLRCGGSDTSAPPFAISTSPPVNDRHSNLNRPLLQRIGGRAWDKVRQNES
jgi:hypothetical protein